MKTAKEITEWLVTRPWYTEFVSIAVQNENREGLVKDILNGKLGAETISSVNFPPDKREFSFSIGDEFYNWYQSEETESIKNDIADDKLRWDLLPLELMEEVVKVFHAGAKKYGPNRWQNLPDGYERYKGAMLRHLVEVEKGNIVDSDTGCYHMAQVVTNALFMLHFKMKEYKENQ